MSFLRHINEIPLKYTWKISKRAWYIRFYLWLWQAKREDVTFCKLFWGYIFIIPALIIRFVIAVGIFLMMIGLGIAETARLVGRMFKWFGRAVRWMLTPDTKQPKVIELPPAPKEKKVKPAREGPSIMSRGLTRVEHGAARTGMTVRSASFTVKHAATPVLRTAAQPVRKTGSISGRAVMAIFIVMRALASLVLSILLAMGEVMGEVIIAATSFAYRRIIRPLSIPVIFLGTGAALVFSKAIVPLLWTLGAIALVGGLGFGLYKLGGLSVHTARNVSLAAIGSWLVGAVVVVAESLWTAGTVTAHSVWVALPYVGLVVVGLVLIALAGIGVSMLMTRVLIRYLPGFITWFFLRPAKYTVYGAKKTGVSFGQIMWIGFKSVKSNTCPKVEIED